MRQVDFSESLKKANQKENISIFVVSAVLVLILIGLSGLMMTIGNTHYTLTEVFKIMQSDQTTGAAYTIKSLRFPKLVVGILVGMSFGMSGYTFQRLLRNPLASPDVIGISAGSSVAAVFCILILHVSGAVSSVMAVICGLATTLFILLISGRKGGYENKMILIGIGMQALLNALINWMLLVGSEYDVASAMRWLRGSLNGVTEADILPACICFIIGAVGLLLIQHPLKMMQLGEEYAISLGVKTNTIRMCALCFALLLVAGGTSITGPIASVAFLSAPLASRFVSKNKSALIQSGFVGAILVLAGELIGQNGFSTRYPVGVITGLLGAPYLLYLLYRMNADKQSPAI